MRQVTTFGLCLVRLDIRQESERHTDVMDAITKYLEIGSYRGWSEKERQEWLLSELKSKRPLFGANLPKTEEVAEVLDTFHVISELPPIVSGHTSSPWLPPLQMCLLLSFCNVNAILRIH